VHRHASARGLRRDLVGTRNGRGRNNRGGTQNVTPVHRF
jgi:hypothetical protein